MTSRWLGLLLVIGLILLLGLTANPISITTALARGDALLASGRPAEALQQYRQAAEHADGIAPAAVRIAQAQLALAQQGPSDPAAFEAARLAWLAAIPYEGFSPAVRRGLAETSLALGDTLAAAEQWALAYAAEPAEPSLWRELAPAHLHKGEWPAAAHAYAAIAQADPENTEAHWWAGVLLLPSEPELARGHLMLARNNPLFRQHCDLLLENLHELRDVTEPAHLAGRIGVAYLEIGEPALALEQFQVALAIEPGYADAWAYLGTSQNLLGKDGRAALARAIELQPENPLAHSLMGRHWLGAARPDLARPEFFRAWELAPNNSAHAADVALTYELEGDLASAEAWYQAAIRRAPSEPAFWQLLARFHLEGLRDVEGGLLAAQKAVALAPQDPAALDMLGWAQLAADQPRLAETNLLAAQRGNPANPAVHFHLGELYASLSKWREARAAFEQAIALDLSCRACSTPQLGSYARLAQRALDQAPP